MVFSVYDNGRPAKYPDSKVDPSWNNNTFDTFEEALEYAHMWLGPFGGSWDGMDGVVLELNVPWDYSGYGDVIEIRGGG